MQTERESAGTVSEDQPSEGATIEGSADDGAPSDDKTAANESLGTRAEVETLGDCKRRIRAFVPREKVQEELDKNYKELATTVQIPGFRKGRIPRALLEARFGKEIISDVKQALLSLSLSEVIEAQKLDVVGEPTISEVELPPSADMSYVVELEVRPVFDLVDYKGLEVARELVPVRDEEVEERLESMRRKAAKLEPIDVAAATMESVYMGKYSLYREGAKVKSGVDVSFVPATKVLGPFFLEDLEERVKSWGAATGSSLKLNVLVPSDYSDEVLRDQMVELEFVLEETRKSVLPEANDEFAKTLDKTSIEEVRGEIRKSIEEWAQRESDKKVEAKIMESVLGSTSVALPEGLIESIVNRRRMEREYELLQRGIPPEEVKAMLVREWGAQQEAPPAAEAAPEKDPSQEAPPGGAPPISTDNPPRQTPVASEEIRREIKEFFVLEKIASNEKIFATEEEVDKRIYLMASLYGVPPGRLREELRSSGRLEELRYSLRNEKVRAFLRKEARILGPDGQPEAKAS